MSKTLQIFTLFCGQIFFLSIHFFAIFHT